MHIVLSYFPIHGAAERVRLALWLGGIAFDDVRVPLAELPKLKSQTPYGAAPRDVHRRRALHRSEQRHAPIRW